MFLLCYFMPYWGNFVSLCGRFMCPCGCFLSSYFVSEAVFAKQARSVNDPCLTEKNRKFSKMLPLEDRLKM